MTRSRRLGRGALVAAALALQGCLLLDGRELQVDPPGTIQGWLGFRVTVDGSLDTFTAEIDGNPLDGVFPAHERVYIPLPPNVGNGTHRLVLRAREGTVPRTAERTLAVDRTTQMIVSAVPAPGRMTSSEAFEITLTFTRPLEPFSVTPQTVSISSHGPVAPVLSPDGRTVSFMLPDRMDVLELFWVYLDVIPAGLPGSWGYIPSIGPWYVPVLHVSVSQPSAGLATNGLFTFAATASSASGESPATTDLLAGDQVIATLGPLPWNAQIDTTSVPEGTYALSLRSPGFFFKGSLPQITVDRTPPQMVRCAPEYSALDDVAGPECVVFELSEPVSFQPPGADLLLAGVSRLASLSYPVLGGPPNNYRICPYRSVDPAVLPATQTVSLPVATDPAGNLLGSNICPAMTVPPWRHPWGEGPLATAQGTLGAGEIALHQYSSGQPESASLLTIPPAGSPDAGSVEVWSSAALSPWSLDRTLDVESSSIASGLGRDVWVESVAGGPGHVYRIDNDPPGPLNQDPARDARHPSGAITGYYSGPAVAWSEELPSGGRGIFVRARESAPGSWYGAGGPPLSDPAAVADEPSIAHGGYKSLFVAWTETAPGGVPQVRVAQGTPSGTTPGMTWDVYSSAVNVDASQAATEPSADSCVVAWREGGQVYARLWSPQDLVTLNSDPARQARSPRLDPSSWCGTVYWVEETPAGDEIWARRYDTLTWTWHPPRGPINAGVSGNVRAFDVMGGAVVWVDDAGAVYLRVANFDL